jgi:uroporphyrin-III C-methyltransferase / precorrin-2 dehydrogenase / sirohydrochlorin ferrochelatase
MHLPLFFKMDHLSCLLVGGGKIAAHKAEILLATGCSLTLIAPEVHPLIRDAIARGKIQWHAREFRQGDCTGHGLIVAATPHEAVNRSVSHEARQKGIPINVVDAPELCTVIFGAIWREGPLSISVSTGGTAPFMAAAVRDHIGNLAHTLVGWIEPASRFRRAVRGEVREMSEREQLYRRFRMQILTCLPESAPPGTGLAEWLQWLEGSDEPAPR